MSKMNNHTKETVRALRNRISLLESENASLQDAIFSERNAAEQAGMEAWEANQIAERAEHNALRAKRDAQEAESAAESRRWEVRRATDELERARSWGDSWGVKRATEKLRRI